MGRQAYMGLTVLLTVLENCATKLPPQMFSGIIPKIIMLLYFVLWMSSLFSSII